MLCLQVCSDRPPNISPSSHALQQSKFDLGEVEVKPVSQPFSILNVPLRFITTIRPKPQKVLRAVAHSTGLVFVESSPPPLRPLKAHLRPARLGLLVKDHIEGINSIYSGS